LIRVWHQIGHLGGAQTAAHATLEDAGNGAMEIVLVIAALAALAVVIYLLIGARQQSSANSAWHGFGAIVSVALSWAVIHTVFTLRYARLYHARGRGIEFNSRSQPSYLDFAYVAFSVGMTYQVSDTAVTARPIRRAVLRHALLSFVFGTVLLAVVVNLLVGLVP
jgi:uncharacterized membrane protein